MAIEMRVYAEITDLDPKVMWGLTWRQMGAVGILAVATAAVGFVLFLVFGLESIRMLPFAIAPVAVPVGAWAWVRPMGIRTEKWAPHMLRTSLSPKRLLYVNHSPNSEDSVRFPGRNSHVSWKEAKRRKEAGA